MQGCLESNTLCAGTKGEARRSEWDGSRWHSPPTLIIVTEAAGETRFGSVSHCGFR